MPCHPVACVTYVEVFLQHTYVRNSAAALFARVHGLVSVWGSKALNTDFLYSFCSHAIVRTVHTGFFMSSAESALPTTEAQSSLGREAEKEHGLFLVITLL